MRRAWPWLVVLALTALGAAAGAAYSELGPKTYTSTAQLMVSPLPASDTTFTGIAVFRDSGGRRTAVQSAAALVESAQTANAVALQFGGKRSRDSLLAAVSAHEISGSDVVAVTARASSPALSAQIANAFAQALVSQRTGLFQSDLATAIQHGTQTLGALAGSQRAALVKRLALLKTYVGQPDPTIKTVAQAEPPSSARGRDLQRAVAVGAGIGLAAGVLFALLLVVLTSWRARRFFEGPQYDRVVFDRLAERHESLLKTLEAAEARLAAREAALAERERTLAGRAEELERRAAELRSHADELPGRAEELLRREAALAERERALEAALAESRPATADPDAERREQELQARVAAVTQRELEVVRRAAALALRERELAGEAAPEPAPEPEPEPEAEPAPPPVTVTVVPPPPAGPAPEPADGRGRWNLHTLARLVEERGQAFPDRVDEWRSTLYHLRDYADYDGAIPASFDWLVEETFTELV